MSQIKKEFKHYKYRIAKRKLAHAILEEMCKNLGWLENYEFSEMDFEEYGFHHQAFLEARPSTIYEQLNSALELLKENEHTFINIDEQDNPHDPPEYVFPSPKGREALREGYYYKENRKDTLEQFELLTRWILPISGLVISILALYFSTRGKK